MKKIKHFYVIVQGTNAGLEIHPMKKWLKENGDYFPPGLDPKHSTSHQLRDGLRKLGWTVNETETEVRLIKPGTPYVEPPIGDGSKSEEFEEQEEMTFEMESQLRDFIAYNLQSIFISGKKLQLYINSSGISGIEFQTDVGNIDILAVNDSGNFFVFELKRAAAPDKAIGQLTRYMGWVKQTLAKGQDVQGIIVAKAISDKLRYATSVIPNVTLFEYQVRFNLKPTESFTTIINVE